ncbi:MAG: aminoglycoside phosphotransferase family protein [Caldilinea sp.]|nr:aminoglycoside phosphotransferase family protein [Caldilinea sp.]MDW8441399.1 aminoglycoside phosphotransferase family protein [Caldilineaceae bacterium]
MPDPTASVYAYLTTAQASGFAGLHVDLLEHWRGDDNLLWKVRAGGEEAVVKLFLDAGQARGRRQFDGQQLFAPQGIAPQPLWFDRYPEGLARQVLVYRWVDGRALQPDDADDLTALAASIAAVHGEEVDAVRRISPRPLNLEYFWSMLSGGLKPMQQWLEEIGCQQISTLLPLLERRGETLVAEGASIWRSMPPTPIHGDLCVENVVLQAGRAVLVDWEMFGLGDSALEVAEFLHRQRGLRRPTLQEHFLAEYASFSGNASAPERVMLYRRLLPLRDASFLLSSARRITPEERAQSEFSRSLPWLIETLTRSLVECIEALGLPMHPDGDDLRSEVELIFSRIGEKR